MFKLNTIRFTGPVSARFFSQPAATRSLFADLGSKTVAPAARAVETAGEKKVDSDDLPPMHLDTAALEFKAPKVVINAETYLTPLKKQLYDENVRLNGFFKNNQVIKLGDKSYRLKLSALELNAVEPSIYLKSFRIKSTWKKTTLVNRMLSGLSLKDAITQCHFNTKKVSKPIGDLLETGIEHAQKMSLNPDECYVDQLWVGSDGSWQKRLDPKGRGRMGIIRHRYVHVRAILKTTQTTKRVAWEKREKELAKRPWFGLDNAAKIRNKPNGWFKW